MTKWSRTFYRFFEKNKNIFCLFSHTKKLKLWISNFCFGKQKFETKMKYFLVWFQFKNSHGTNFINLFLGYFLCPLYSIVLECNLKH